MVSPSMHAQSDGRTARDGVSYRRGIPAVVIASAVLIDFHLIPLASNIHQQLFHSSSMTTPQIKQEYIAPEDPEPESATSDEQERAGDGKDWREKWRVDAVGNDRSTANIR
jgi:hypothetical protein